MELDDVMFKCEMVFDMTTVACEILGRHPELAKNGYDSRDLCCAIYWWATEFERDVLDEDEGEYMDQIEEFAHKKLKEYFGLEG